MDYLIVYLDKNGEKTAAIPDDEGVYYNHVDFEEYTPKMSKREVVILESEDFYDKVNNPDSDGKFFKAKFSAKYITNTKVCEAIEDIGFTTFFTTIIKEHLREED